eukprot:2200496-Prymnesium_polylepis.1
MNEGIPKAPTPRIHPPPVVFAESDPLALFQRFKWKLVGQVVEHVGQVEAFGRELDADNKAN